MTVKLIEKIFEIDFRCLRTGYPDDLVAKWEVMRLVKAFDICVGLYLRRYHS